jgi:hypothetical protein
MSIPATAAANPVAVSVSRNETEEEYQANLAAFNVAMRQFVNRESKASAPVAANDPDWSSVDDGTFVFSETPTQARPPQPQQPCPASAASANEGRNSVDPSHSTAAETGTAPASRFRPSANVESAVDRNWSAPVARVSLAQAKAKLGARWAASDCMLNEIDSLSVRMLVSASIRGFADLLTVLVVCCQLRCYQLW